MEKIGYLVITLISSAYTSMLGGWGLTVLWDWFIVTTFGLPSLTIPAAIGLALISGFLTHQHKLESEETDQAEQALVRIIFVTLYVFISLGLGWVVNLFM